MDSIIFSSMCHAGMYTSSLGAHVPFARFPGYFGPFLYTRWALYSLAANPLMVLVGFHFDDARGIQVSQALVLGLLAGSTAVAVAGGVLMAVMMSPSHRRSFWGRQSLREYVSELFDSRTYAPVGMGSDASRAHLLKFSRCGSEWGIPLFSLLCYVVVQLLHFGKNSAAPPHNPRHRFSQTTPR